MSPRTEAAERDSLLQGTLDLLILRILSMGPHHGHGITISILTRSGDTLLVAGKGHETGQEIAGTVHPFDDRDVLRDVITTLGRTA